MTDSKGNTAAAAPSRRRRFSFESIISVMDSIGTAWVFFLLIIINADILGRALFNHPIRGVPEVVAMSIVALVFLQVAHTTHVGRLTRSDVLLAWLTNNHPRIGDFLQGIYHLVGVFLFIILFYATVPIFIKAWKIEEYVGAQGDFMAPVWPVKLIILIGCVAGGIEFLLLSIRHFIKAGKGGGRD